MFVAIDLDEAIKTSAFALRAPQKHALGPAFKFANPKQAHLTLAFMADVAADRVVPAFEQPIDMRAFDVTFGGLGAFPPRGAPRVLWLGMADGAREVVALQKAVADRLQSLGIALEDRTFHPHLTLGRWRESRPSDRPAISADRTSIGRMTVDHVTLYESRLSSEGPTHIPRAQARLEPVEP